MGFLRRRPENTPSVKKRIPILRWIVGALLLPVLLWAGILLIVPTEHARVKIVEALSRASGRTVRLSAVRLGVCGGVRLEGLEIAETAHTADPWLKAETLALDLSILQLVSGQLLPKEIRAEGVSLRVHRRADGSLEFGDLIPGTRPRSTDSRDPGDDSDVPEVAFKISRAHVSIHDDPSDTRLELIALDAQGTWQRDAVALSSAKAQLNGGSVELRGALDRSAIGPSVEGTFKANALSYVAPVLANAPPSFDGRLKLELILKGRCGSSQELARTAKGEGRMVVEPITLEGSTFVAELARATHISPSERVGSVTSNFEIGDNRVTSKNLTINVSRVPVVLVGWTSFDGQVDYQLKTDQLTQKIAKETHGLLDELAFDLSGLATLRLRGDLHHLVWTVPDPTVSARGGQDEERLEDRFRQIGRHLKDRILR